MGVVFVFDSGDDTFWFTHEPYTLMQETGALQKAAKSEQRLRWCVLRSPQSTISLLSQETPTATWREGCHGRRPTTQYRTPAPGVRHVRRGCPAHVSHSSREALPSSRVCGP